MDDDDVDLIDEDELLDEEDMVKPDQSTLRVCGTTGKRKACKDCSCGLAEEIEAGGEIKTKSFTSSCGSVRIFHIFLSASQLASRAPRNQYLEGILGGQLQGVTKKWTPFVTNSSPFRPFFRDSFEIFDRKGQK